MPKLKKYDAIVLIERIWWTNVKRKRQITKAVAKQSGLPYNQLVEYGKRVQRFSLLLKKISQNKA